MQVVYCISFFSVLVVICCFPFQSEKEEGITGSLTKSVVQPEKKVSLSECLWMLLVDSEKIF